MSARIEMVAHLGELLGRHGIRLDARTAEALLRMPMAQLQAIESLVAVGLAGQLERDE